MAWALSVCEPSESGLGGITVALVRAPDGTTHAVDGGARAPRDASVARLKKRERRTGPTGAVVPTTPAALDLLHRRFGTLPREAIVAPAIALAEEGFAPPRLLKTQLRWMRRHFKPGGPEAEWRDAVERDGTLRQPALARTLRVLSERGIEDFYHGTIARELTRTPGVLITDADLAAVEPTISEANVLRAEYHGLTCLSIGPPSGGASVLLALRILDALGPLPEDEGERVIAVARATKAALVERERWPDHPKDLTESSRAWLVSPARASAIAARLIEGNEPAPPRRVLGESGNTTHLCVADSHGWVVSLTQSIQSVFGGKFLHPTLGFFLNNYLCTCPTWPHPYRLAPGSLPQSNAAPTFVLDAAGRPKLAIGSAGSRRITSSIVRVIAEVIGVGRTLNDALTAPRAHALIGGEGGGGGVWLERDLPARVQTRLAARFGDVKLLPKHSPVLGGVQAIHWHNDDVHPAADPRRDGTAHRVLAANDSHT